MAAAVWFRRGGAAGIPDSGGGATAGGITGFTQSDGKWASASSVIAARRDIDAVLPPVSGFLSGDLIMKYTFLILSALGGMHVCGEGPPKAVTASTDEGKGVVTVKIGDEVFTELHYKEYAKPILSPINGPTGARMTRQWPMGDALPDEATDHPHHKGLWFTHGEVNGVDFWAESPKTGQIRVSGVPVVKQEGGNVTVQTSENWKGPDEKLVCTSATTITCGTDGDDRFVDYTIKINASEGDVTFGDTKEGTMGIRSCPALNLKGKGAAGHAVNSEGVKDEAIWSKAARWVDYSGKVDGKVTGIACFDHPSNLRHPTTWHAREYGLIAANPFGLHDFEKKPKGAGDYLIKKGDSLTFRYRWLFHNGDTDAAKIEERWKKWAGK
jgi:hypothetical protein